MRGGGLRILAAAGGVCVIVRLIPPVLRRLRWKRGTGDDPVGCGLRWRVVFVVEACTAVVLVDGMRLVSWAALSIVPGTWRSQTYVESCRSRGWRVAQDGTRRKTGRACYLRVVRSHGVSTAVGRVRGLMGCVGAVGMAYGR